MVINIKNSIGCQIILDNYLVNYNIWDAIEKWNVAQHTVETSAES